MSFKRSIRLFAAWTALVAIVLGAVIPAMSHALGHAASKDKRWVEVCTVAGTKLVAVDVQSNDDPTSHLLAAERCMFCASHGAVTLPAQQIPPLILKGGADEFPVLYFHAPRPLFAWITAPSRAPPLLALA